MRRWGLWLSFYVSVFVKKEEPISCGHLMELFIMTVISVSTEVPRAHVNGNENDKPWCQPHAERTFPEPYSSPRLCDTVILLWGSVLGPFPYFDLTLFLASYAPKVLWCQSALALVMAMAGKKARNTTLFITHGMDTGSGVWQIQANSYFCGKSPHAPGGASQPESFPHLQRPGSLHLPSALRFRAAIIITLFLCNTSVHQTFSQILLFE